MRPALARGLSGFVYTQIADVEQETNGPTTYDRKVVKVDVDKVRASNAGLVAQFEEAVGRTPAPVPVTEIETSPPRST